MPSLEEMSVLELARALANELWAHLVNEETDEPWTECIANALLEHPLVRDVQEENRRRFRAFKERQEEARLHA